MLSSLGCEPATPADAPPTPIDPVGAAALRAREQARADAVVSDATTMIAAPSHAMRRVTEQPEATAEPEATADADRARAQLKWLVRPTMIALRDAWSGVNESHDHRAVLRRTGTSFVGELRCEVRGRAGWSAIAWRASAIDAVIDRLTVVSLEARYAQHASERASEFSSRAIAVRFGLSTAVFRSSLSEDGVPWSVFDASHERTIPFDLRASRRRVEHAITVGSAAPNDALTALREAADFTRCERFAACVLRARLDERVQCAGFKADSVFEPPAEARRVGAPPVWEANQYFER